MDLNGKRVVLTGAASGIGRALFDRLLPERVQLVAADLNISTLPTTSPNIHLYACDLSEQQNVDALFDFACEKMGGIDVFIANAGFAYYERIAAPDWEHIDRIFRLNVYSPLYSAEKMAELHRVASTPYTVVITASAMSHLALPGYALYAATKAANHRFAEGYRFEMPPNGHLMLVYPIATRTRFFATAANAAPVPFPSQTPEYVAARILSGLQRDAQAVYPSVLFIVYNWLCGIFPPLRPIQHSISARQFNHWLNKQSAP